MAIKRILAFNAQKSVKRLLDDNVVFYALKELVAYALNLLDFLDRSEVVVLAVIDDCLCLAFAYAFERFKLLDACGVDIDNPKQKPSAHAQECKNFFHRISFKFDDGILAKIHKFQVKVSEKI